MVRSNVGTRSGPAVAIYMVMAREYVTNCPEKEFKEAVKNIGGSYNKSGLFLSSTCVEAIVNKKNGISRRSVLYVPRVHVPMDLLALLNKCESLVITSNYYIITNMNIQNCL